jgi:hypothetical protein
LAEESLGFVLADNGLVDMTIAGTEQTATGGAIKAKAAADYATSLHDAEQWDTTEATAASAASWEACRSG